MNDSTALSHQPPVPARSRWQPLRLGLVNLYHYDNEELRFADGNLLLRGNNGTGKSKILALTLPFLLDGQLTPSRVEPDGDPNKRMEWNLLMGGQHGERLGYTWLELGRLDDEGAPEVVTLGCGLRAVGGRGKVESWFFMTERRVNQDLHLISNSEVALTRERLIEALGSEGRVFDTAGQYRRAVDERLFHLGEARYEALVNLLIQLRQPQLSKRPDPTRLSRALTDALSPLDPTIVRDVADAFRNLDAQRADLQALESSRDALDRFVSRYRHYARAAARRRSAEVRRAHSDYEHSRGELNRAREEHSQAAAERERATAGIEEQREALDRARAREQALRESPQMREARDLEAAEERAAALAEEAERADEQRATHEADTELAREQCHAHRRGADETRQALAHGQQRLEAHAGPAGLTATQAALVEGLALPDGEGLSHGPAAVDRLRREVDEAVAGRERGLAHLEALGGRCREAGAAVHEAAERRDERQREHEALGEARRAADAQIAEAGAALVGAFGVALREARVLQTEDLDTVLAELEGWVETLDGPNPARRAAEQAHRAAADQLAEAVQTRRGEQRELAAERAALEAEREALTTQGVSGPPAPYTRADAGREGRAGAPLWKLVDFREGGDAPVRAGVEAALEAAGLLDAWVLPDGRLLDPGTWDTVLVPETPVDDNLTQVLVPAVAAAPDAGDGGAAAVGEATVTAVLEGIGWGASTGSGPAESARVWVAADGRWRVGPAWGQWAKAEAELIGHAAREAARRRRLAELAEQLEACAQREAQCRQALEALAEQRRVLDGELDALPDDEALRAAHFRAGELARQQIALQSRIEEIEAELARAREQLERAEAERDQAAADLALPADAEGLAAVRQAVTEYKAALGAFWPTLEHHWSRLLEHQASQERLAALEARLEAARTHAGERTRAAREAAARRDTLRESVGETVEALYEQLHAAQAAMSAAEQALETERQSERDAYAREQALSTRAEDLAEQVSERDRRRGEAIERLQALAPMGLLAMAAPDVELPPDRGPGQAPDRSPGQAPAETAWAAEPAVRLARRLEQELAEAPVGDSAWETLQQQIFQDFEILKQALSRHGYDAVGEYRGDLVGFQVTFQGRGWRPNELAEALRDEIAAQQEILDNKERELLEQHLINDVASHLQQMVRQAEQQVERMNHELERRPTSTGMRLRLQWRTLAEGERGADGREAPAGLAEARKRLLRQSTDAWSPADREAVGRFLQDQIKRVREADEGGSLYEQLERALDYRYWHQFTIERRQDGAWRKAYGPASGGERALVVTLPLFAAASAHYSSAGAHAPRLVLLDEAFAGVDDDARAKCMGLLAEFDLDYVMTSERLWGCYPDVPGLAIAHLARIESVNAVHITRWRWDGARRHREPDPLRGEAQDVAAADAAP